MSTTIDEYDQLSTEDLRERAFKVAWHRHDLGFFVDVLRILPAAADSEINDGSFAGFGQELADIVGVWRNFTGHGYGKAEPLVRAKFIDYLMAHQAD